MKSCDWSKKYLYHTVQISRLGYRCWKCYYYFSLYLNPVLLVLVDRILLLNKYVFVYFQITVLTQRGEKYEFKANTWLIKKNVYYPVTNLVSGT